MKIQKGFTLIELVVVIVILGILAVTAAPKFLDIQDEAKTSAVYGLAGAMRGALAMTYAQATIENKQNLPNATIKVDGEDVILMYGYPGDQEQLEKVVTGLEDWQSTSKGLSGITDMNGVEQYGFDNFDCHVDYLVPMDHPSGELIPTHGWVEVNGSSCKGVDER